MGWLHQFYNNEEMFLAAPVRYPDFPNRPDENLLYRDCSANCSTFYEWRVRRLQTFLKHASPKKIVDIGFVF